MPHGQMSSVFLCTDFLFRSGSRGGGVVWRRGGVRDARSRDWPDGCNGRRSRLAGGMDAPVFQGLELLPIATSGKGNGVRVFVVRVWGVVVMLGCVVMVVVVGVI